MWFYCIILDSLIVAVKPKPPVKDGHENDDDDDEDLVKSIKQHLMKWLKCQFGSWCHVSISAEVSASSVIKSVEKEAILFSTW